MQSKDGSENKIFHLRNYLLTVTSTTQTKLLSNERIKASFDNKCDWYHSAVDQSNDSSVDQNDDSAVDLSFE